MTLFAMQGVSKRYGGVHALQQANLSVEAGRIHAVLGENGAGKSTLIKIMAGVVAPDQGDMLLNGRPVAFASPAAANAAGIVCVFQELSLIPDLTVADNIAALSLLAYREGASTLLNVLEAQRTSRATLAQYIDDLATARNAAGLVRLLTLSAATKP